MYLKTEVRFLNSQTPDIVPQCEGPVDLASLPSTDMFVACSGEFSQFSNGFLYIINDSICRSQVSLKISLYS